MNMCNSAHLWRSGFKAFLFPQISASQPQPRNAAGEKHPGTGSDTLLATTAIIMDTIGSDVAQISIALTIEALRTNGNHQNHNNNIDDNQNKLKYYSTS